MDRPGPRSRSLSLAGAVLVALWALMAVVIAGAYRPGGLLDPIVAVSAFLPPAVAAAGVAWPATPRTSRDLVGLAWIWLAALLLTVPLLGALVGSLGVDGPRRLVPSLETAYAGLLAVGSTSLFSLLGPLHRRRDQAVFERSASLRALALTVAVTAATGVVIGGLLVVNERTLGPEASATSRYGPTDPAIVPPECDQAPRLGPHADVTVEARLLADDRSVARAALAGRRSGRDEVWGGRWSGVPASSVAPLTTRPSGRVAYRRVGAQAWLNAVTDDPGAPGSTWFEVPPDPFGLADAARLTMDGPPRATVGGERGPIVTEDLGIEVIEGARSRHCRTFVDGPTALAAFLPLRWLVSGTSTGLPTDLPAWRGELDWWVFGDGQLGRAALEISGLRSDAWSSPNAIEGALRAELEATERGRAVVIPAPAGSRTPGSGPAVESATP